MYELRCRLPRDDIAAMMTATTWMDAKEALEAGFIDKIAEGANKGATNVARVHTVDRHVAEQMVAAYFERQRLRPIHDHHTPEPAPEQVCSGVPIEQLQRRLDLIKM